MVLVLSTHVGPQRQHPTGLLHLQVQMEKTRMQRSSSISSQGRGREH